jgi:hypothetical protein
MLIFAPSTLTGPRNVSGSWGPSKNWTVAKPFVSLAGDGGAGATAPGGGVQPTHTNWVSGETEGEALGMRLTRYVGMKGGNSTEGAASDIVYSTFISGMLFWSFSLLHVTVHPVVCQLV